MLHTDAGIFANCIWKWTKELIPPDNKRGTCDLVNANTNAHGGEQGFIYGARSIEAKESL